MEAFSFDKSINSAHALVKELFDAYAVEREIRRQVTDMGKTALIAELKKKEVAGRTDILKGEAEADGENLKFHPIAAF